MLFLAGGHDALNLVLELMSMLIRVIVFKFEHSLVAGLLPVEIEGLRNDSFVGDPLLVGREFLMHLALKTILRNILELPLNLLVVSLDNFLPNQPNFESFEANFNVN